MDKVKVDMADIAKDITVTVSVKGVKEFQIRLWLTVQILKLAARVSRFQISFGGWSNNADIQG